MLEVVVYETEEGRAPLEEWFDSLDTQAALKVATIARFSPAKNRDKTIAVWVKLDVTFTSN